MALNTPRLISCPIEVETLNIANGQFRINFMSPNKHPPIVSLTVQVAEGKIINIHSSAFDASAVSSEINDEVKERILDTISNHIKAHGPVDQ